MTVKKILHGLKSIIEEKENGVVEMDIKTGLIYPTTMKLCSDDCKILLDYITNLQQENEKLKETVENLTTMTVCGDKKQIKNTAQYKLDIYKSRCEKAIEYIKKLSNKPNVFGHYGIDTECKKWLLNILNGGDKE